MVTDCKLLNNAFDQTGCYLSLSHDVVSGSDIMPCNKIDKPLVVYRFSGNVTASIIRLRKIRQNLDVFTPKMQFLSIFNVM